MKIKLIYLAAGNSRRFGKNGENKLLYLLNGKPMFRHLFDCLAEICIRHPEWELFLVTQYPEIADQLFDKAEKDLAARYAVYKKMAAQEG